MSAGFALTKGSAVCQHGIWYRRDQLESTLLGRFRAAMTPAMIETLARAVAVQVAAAGRARDQRGEGLKAEILDLERQAGHLVRFVASGGDSPSVRQELAALDGALQGLRVELVALDRRPAVPEPRVSSAWILAQLERLDALLQTDVARAKAELVKHLDGALTITPQPSPPGERRVEIGGRVKSHSLLGGDQEAACLQLVAGARIGLWKRPVLDFAFSLRY